MERRGPATTEFWLSIMGVFVGLWLVERGHEIGATVIVAALGSYGLSRGLAKQGGERR